MPETTTTSPAATPGATPRYASPTDVATHGRYTIRRDPGDTRPLYRFAGRITADGSSGCARSPAATTSTPGGSVRGRSA
jgi:putative glutathione S-transferase